MSSLIRTRKKQRQMCKGRFWLSKVSRAEVFPKGQEQKSVVCTKQRNQCVKSSLCRKALLLLNSPTENSGGWFCLHKPQTGCLTQCFKLFLIYCRQFTIVTVPLLIIYPEGKNCECLH